jgi:hypothetical protein
MTNFRFNYKRLVRAPKNREVNSLSHSIDCVEAPGAVKNRAFEWEDLRMAMSWRLFDGIGSLWKVM